MYQGVQILSTVYIGLLGRTLLVHPRLLEIKLQRGNSQTYIERIQIWIRFELRDTNPPSRRPYELAGETIQSNCSCGPDFRFSSMHSTMENLSMTSGTCSLNASFQSSMREWFISNKMNSRSSMVKMRLPHDVATLDFSPAPSVS